MNRVLWDNIKLTNMHIMQKHFPILMENTHLHIQEVQQKCRKNSKSRVLVRILQKSRTDKICVCLSLSCYKNVLQTRWLITTENYFTVLKVEKYKIMRLAD